MSLPAESTGSQAEASSVEDLSLAQASSPIATNGSQTQDVRTQPLAVGTALLVVGVGATAFSHFAGAYPWAVQLSGVLGLVASGVLAFDFAAALRIPPERRSIMMLIGMGGAALVCLASIFAAFTKAPTSELLFSAVLGGPALATAAVVLLRALIGRVWDSVDSRSSLVDGFGISSSKTVAEGEVFTLSAGVIVPTDGRIRSGSCAVLERYLSPDTHFRVKDETDIVFSGSYVLGGSAEVQALTHSYESCLRRLEGAALPGLRWVEDSLRRDNERHVVKISYLLIFLSVVSAIFWDERSGGNVVTMLVASGTVLLCSCIVQLGEALYGLRARLVRTWAQRGFLINSAKAWTELFGTHEIVPDPSTVDSSTDCHVRELELLDDRINEASLCACIASVLGRADDTALATIGDYCQHIVGSLVPDRVVDLREYSGRGLSGVVKGVEFSIGSEDFLVERGILIQPTESSFGAGSHDQVVLVAIGDDLIARFWVSYGQESLFSTEAVHDWPKGLHGSVLDPEVRELSSDSLLVRGKESDAIGRVHSPEVVFFDKSRLEMPTASVVSLTSHIALLPILVKECRKHMRDVTRARAWILFAGFASLVLVFAGVVTPLLPVALLPILVALISL